MVGSYEARFARWYPVLRLNPRSAGDEGKLDGRHQERVEAAGEMMVQLVKNYQAKNKNCLPDRIVLFRDGLSESQFRMACEEEIKDIKDKLDAYCGSVSKDAKRPPILVICTVKRHHTRFYGKDQPKLHDKAGNPQPGVVFYDSVTSGEKKDFFMVSHRTLQGTARPTHYVVLENEISDISLSYIAQAVSVSSRTMVAFY